MKKIFHKESGFIKQKIMTISNWIWKGIKNIAKLILGIIVVVAFVTFFIVPFLHNSIDRTLAQWIWYPAVSISILFFVIDNIRSKRPAFKTPIIDFLSKWGEISIFPVFISLFVFNYYEIKYIWMWVLFGIAAIFILAFFLSLLMFYIRINQLSEEEKHTSVMNIMKSILLYLFIDLLYMSIFNDWLIPTFIFGVLAIAIVFFNLVKAFLYGAKILHFLITLEMIIALALSGYLIFIIPNESLQEIVLSIVAALCGGILTLVGVAWTIKDSNEKRQEDFKRIEDARKEEERKKHIPYIRVANKENSTVNISIAKINSIDLTDNIDWEKLHENTFISIYRISMLIKNISSNNIILYGAFIDDVFYDFETTTILETGAVCKIEIGDKPIMCFDGEIEFIDLYISDVYENYYKVSCIFSYDDTERQMKILTKVNENFYSKTKSLRIEGFQLPKLFKKDM